MRSGADLENQSRFWGLPFVDSPHFKPNAGINFGNAYLTLVGHVKEGEFFDLDTDITYVQPLSETFSANAGLMRFDFNDPEKGWIVGYVPHAGLSAKIPGNPSIGYNHLIGFGGGDYLEGAVSGSASVMGREVDLFAKVGYNMNAMIDGQRFTHVQGTMGVPLKISGISINPYVNGFVPLSDKGDLEPGFTFGVSAKKDL